MDSDEETLYDDVDSGNESSGDDVDFAMEVETNNPRERPADVDEYPFEVLSTEEIVQHMVDSIKDVNTVVEVNSSSWAWFVIKITAFRSKKVVFLVFLLKNERQI